MTISKNNYRKITREEVFFRKIRLAMIHICNHADLMQAHLGPFLTTPGPPERTAGCPTVHSLEWE